jgi:hypothetical protein
MSGRDLQRALSQGLKVLREAKQPDGSFVSYSSPMASQFSENLSYRTVFMPALILGALAENDRSEAQAVRRGLREYLQRQRGPGGGYNYWDRQSSEYVSQACPDDLDDTCCTLIGLVRDRPQRMTGDLLAEIARLLIATEVAPGGPYRTWLLGQELAGWQDVDLAVNANVGRLLALAKVEVPGVNNLIEEAIVQDRLSSPYYPSALPIIYFLSFWYRGSCQEMLAKAAYSGLMDSLERRSALGLALTVTALLNLGAGVSEVAEAMEALLRLQTADGWAAEGFCIDPTLQGQPYVAGSSALTTALCIEALERYERASRPPLPVTSARYPGILAGVTIDQVHQEVARGLQQLPLALRAEADDWQRRIQQQDRDGQIALLPAMTVEVVGPRSSLAHQSLVTLGAANVLGWMAYTVLDDIIDGDMATTATPTMVAVMRLMRQWFTAALPHDAAFQRLVDETLMNADAANRWELTHCRFTDDQVVLTAMGEFGDYKLLAERSAGHMLGAAAVLALAGWPVAGEANRKLRQAWQHLLIARQLNDDAHDWQTDLQRGRLNAVSVLLIRQEWSGQSGRVHPIAGIDALQQRFWNKTIQDVAEAINDHCRSVRQLLSHNPAVADPAPMLGLLEPLERSAQDALTGRRQTQAFIRRFSETK